MNAEKQNGCSPASHVNPAIFDPPKPEYSVVSTLPEPGVMAGLEYVLASALLPQCPDTRNRSEPVYLAWEQQIAEDIGQRGVQNPLHVLRLPDRRLQVLAGETRRRARLIAGDAPVPVIIHDKPMSEGEIALEQLLDDEMRCPLTDMERAEKYLRLLDLNQWSRAQLAQHVCKSQSVVCKLLAPFEAFPEDLRACIGRGEGKLPITGAAAIARLGSEAAIRETVEFVLAKGLKRDAIVALVNQRLGQKPKSEKPLKLKAGGIDMTIRKPTPEGIQAFLDAVAGALRKLAKDNLPMRVLPDLLKG